MRLLRVRPPLILGHNSEVITSKCLRAHSEMELTSLAFRYPPVKMQAPLATISSEGIPTTTVEPDRTTNPISKLNSRLR